MFDISTDRPKMQKFEHWLHAYILNMEVADPLPYLCIKIFFPMMWFLWLVGGSAFCNFQWLKVPEKTLGGISPGFGIVVEDEPSELSCILVIVHVHVFEKQKRDNFGWWLNFCYE